MNLYESTNKWLDKMIKEDENEYERAHHDRQLGSEDGSAKTEATIQVLQALTTIAEDYVKKLSIVINSNIDEAIKKQLLNGVLAGGQGSTPSFAFTNALIARAKKTIADVKIDLIDIDKNTNSDGMVK